MSTYDSYGRADGDPPRRQRRSRRSDRDRDDDYDDEPRYVETRETYVARTPTAPDAPYSRASELARRPERQDSELSVEEVRREFPPPQGAAYVQSRTLIKRDERYNDDLRPRSADYRGYDDYDRDAYAGYRGDRRGGDRRDDRGDRRGRDPAVVVAATEVKARRRSLSRNQKIISGVAGAALAVAGKELFDRRKDIKRAPENRNLLGTAAIGAAGAFAGYEGAEIISKRVLKPDLKEEKYIAVRDKNGKVAEYYSSDSEPEKRPKPSRRKSIVDQALAFAGVGGAKAALDSRDRRGSDDDRRSRRGSSGGANETRAKIQQAAKAALLAGAAEAFRVRNEPGGWAGAKGQRILTAVIGATAIDAAADRDPNKHGTRHILESVIGGLAGTRLINGSRKDIVEDDDGRSVHDRARSRSRAPGRSRSRGPGNEGGGGGAGGVLAALAAAGLAGVAGKKVLDRDRSQSRSNRDRRRYSDDEDDRGGSRKRSKSVTDYARKGLAAIGLGGAASDVGKDRSRSRDGRRDRDADYEDARTSRGGGRRRRGGSPDSEDDYDRPRRPRNDVSGPVASGSLGAYEGSRGGGGRDRGSRYDGGEDYDDTRSQRSGRGGGKSRQDKEGDRAKRVAEGKESESSSDLGSSTDDEKRLRKMKGKQLLTAGLATVATIHAAHNVYQSMEKRDARHKAVQEGKLTPTEAQKLKTKARLQDAASIGIAALGLKGAYSEWKEMKEMHDETKEFDEKRGERHEKRMRRLQKQREEAKGNGGGPGQRPAYKRIESQSSPDLYQMGRYDDRGGPPRYLDDNPYNRG